MKRPATDLSRDQWVILLLVITGLFSIATRLFPALMTGFPLNDGGMFLVMVRDLRANGFSLPAFTSYNFQNIPYAYPPFGMYAAGLIGALGIPDLELLRWLPVLFNLLTIPAFFLLARELLNDPVQASAAAMIYALVPDSFTWQIMGGGLTRAPGMLFLLLAQYHALRMFRGGSRRRVLLTALFCALTILSHPEAGLAAASSCALLWVWFGRSREGTLRAALAAAGALALTAPWWGSVLRLHGTAPFESVLFSGGYGNVLGVSLRAFFNPVDLWTGTFHLVLLAGLVWSLYRRRWLLPLWLALPFLVEPRPAPAYAYIPAVILAAQALTEALLALLKRPADLEWKVIRAVVLSLAVLWFVQSLLFGYRIRNTSLVPPRPQEAMRWVGANTPAGSRFITLTGNPDAMTDPLQEWFPALSGRRNLTTLQGGEWTLGRLFFAYRAELGRLQACGDPACLEERAAITGSDFTHVFVERNLNTERLLDSLSRDSRYRLLYENGDHFIFAR